jgi:excisionase family DNA binding protein
MVSRVQVAERTVRAADEEQAAQRIQEELDRPYGFLGGWRTTATDMDIVEVTASVDTAPGEVGRGALLLSVTDAAVHLGVRRGAVYELLAAGEIAHVSIGRRRYISREALVAFVEAHSRLGME